MNVVTDIFFLQLLPSHSICQMHAQKDIAKGKRCCSFYCLNGREISYCNSFLLFELLLMLIRLMWLFYGPSRRLHHTYLLAAVATAAAFLPLVRSLCMRAFACMRMSVFFPFSLWKNFLILSALRSVTYIREFCCAMFLVSCAFNSCSNKCDQFVVFSNSYLLLFMMILFCFAFVDFLLWSSIFSIYLRVFFSLSSSAHNLVPNNKYYIIWIWMWLQSFRESKNHLYEKFIWFFVVIWKHNAELFRNFYAVWLVLFCVRWRLAANDHIDSATETENER